MQSKYVEIHFDIENVLGSAPKTAVQVLCLLISE